MGLGAVVSSIGVIYTLIKDIPQLIVATSDVKKLTLARELYRVTELLDIIISRGNEIILVLDEALKADDNNIFNRLYGKYNNPYVDKVHTLVSQQGISLAELERIISHIRRALDIFSPELSLSLHETSNSKSGLIGQLMHNFAYPGRPLLVTDSFEGKTYNLRLLTERAAYLSKARGRLEELGRAKVELYGFLRDHYEPHHLL